MADYVLIHGSWHGGWCWERLSPLLVAEGHRVHAPTLVGLANRAAEATRETGLGVHVQQIATLLEDEELRDAVLVGHSYGVMILTGVAERVPDRIGRLVYFDGPVPDHDQSLFDLLPGMEANFQAAADADGDGWLVPPIMSPSDLGVFDPEEAAWLSARLTPTPILTFRERVFAPRRRDRDLPRHYILCARPGSKRFAQKAAREAALVSEGFETVATLEAGHDAQVTHPTELARLLIGVGQHTKR